jgi:ketosteroid isomerase-like protein
MNGTVVQEIVALEDSLTQATRALDVDALDRIYADDIVMTSVLGERCGKTVVLDEARRGVAQRESASACGKPITSSYD